MMRGDGDASGPPPQRIQLRGAGGLPQGVRGVAHGVGVAGLEARLLRQTPLRLRPRGHAEARRPAPTPSQGFSRFPRSFSGILSLHASPNTASLSSGVFRKLVAPPEMGQLLRSLKGMHPPASLCCEQ